MKTKNDKSEHFAKSINIKIITFLKLLRFEIMRQEKLTERFMNEHAQIEHLMKTICQICTFV
jgi:hypothetical protein